MVLRVTQLPPKATGAQVETWIATVQRSAARGGAPPPAGLPAAAPSGTTATGTQRTSRCDARTQHDRTAPGAMLPGRSVRRRGQSSGCMIPGGRFLASGSRWWPQIAVWL